VAVSERREAPPLPPPSLYLSVVIQTRNDDYAGGMLLRLSRMLRTTVRILLDAELGGDAEILIVEWNPPAEAERLAQALELAREPGTEAVPIRVITVPAEYHRAVVSHKMHPIWEHVAENVAFRRAKGRFFLKTNIDNIFSPDIASFLRHRALMDGAVYRATYLEADMQQQAIGEEDAARDVLDWLFSQDAVLGSAREKHDELARKYPYDVHACEYGGSEESFEFPFDQHPGSHNDWYWAGSGDFVLVSREGVEAAGGYPEIAQNWQTDDLIHCRLRALGYRQVLLLPPCVTVHQNHRRVNRIRAGTRWIVTDDTMGHVCANPFDPLPTDRSVTLGWGYPGEHFEEAVV